MWLAGLDIVAADALAWQTAHARSLHARINSAALDALKAGTIA